MSTSKATEVKHQWNLVSRAPEATIEVCVKCGISKTTSPSKPAGKFFSKYTDRNGKSTSHRPQCIAPKYQNTLIRPDGTISTKYSADKPYCHQEFQELRGTGIRDTQVNEQTCIHYKTVEGIGEFMLIAIVYPDPKEITYQSLLADSLESLQQLILRTATGPDRELLCDLNIHLQYMQKLAVDMDSNVVAKIDWYCDAGFDSVEKKVLELSNKQQESYTDMSILFADIYRIMQEYRALLGKIIQERKDSTESSMWKLHQRYKELHSPLSFELWLKECHYIQ